MKPAPFDYAAPASLAEAASLLAAADGEAKILAGGQSLMPLLNMRLARPRLLVDIARVPALDYVREENGAIAVGAMTRQRTLERSALATRAAPLLHEAMLHIAHPQNRNQGTVCGSLAHADPDKVKRLERAIERGLIRWHALPFTTHSELMSPALFEAGLSFSQELDRRSPSVRAFGCRCPGADRGMRRDRRRVFVAFQAETGGRVHRFAEGSGRRRPSPGGTGLRP